MDSKLVTHIFLGAAAVAAVVALVAVVISVPDPDAPPALEVEGGFMNDANFTVNGQPVGGNAQQAPPPSGPTPTEIAADGWVTTDSGLRYALLSPGSGSPPVTDQVVTVSWRTWLSEGTLVDDSRGPQQVIVGRTRLPPAWEEAIPLLRPGGRLQMEVPPALAYGQQGPEDIPQDATLIVELQLHDVAGLRTPPEAPQQRDASAYTTSETGLRHIDLTVGDGPVPTETAQVVVEYTLWVQGGQRIMSTYEQTEPLTEALDRTTSWMREGLATMRVGGSRQLIIPPALAYGEQGQPPLIPPNATLVCELQLVEIR